MGPALGLAWPAATSSSPAQIAGSAPRLASYNLMDDAITFLDLADRILNSDAQVFLAYDAHQAFDLMQYLSGAAALIDLDLKGKDGLWLMQKIREKFPGLPIIAVSRILGVP